MNPDRNREQKSLQAVKFCQENNCWGKKAISSGVCHSIKGFRTINKALDNGLGDDNLSSRMNDSSILTAEEEYLIVSYNGEVSRDMEKFQGIWRSFEWFGED